VGIANTAVSSLSNTSATFNAVLEGTQAVFNVSVYWGDNDGGATFGSWDNTNSIGSHTNVASTNLDFSTTSLSQGTEYFYTFLAQNDATNMWATPSITFTTDTVIANSAVTSLSSSSAVFNATLYAPSDTYDVYAYWGTSDQGVAGAWENTNFIGTYNNVASQDVNFATNNLSDSTAYYYAFVAVDGAYNAWAQPSIRLDTFGRP
ncbi:MAG: hypothetical protein QGH15_23695, partial [Kiritimatiellia bacterium]|nr:hypothetical protein [Kiritimatiellia bacterium]